MEGRCPGKSPCLTLGRAKSSEEGDRAGHSGENSISGKTGIHFKIMAQRVAGLFSSQAEQHLNTYISPPTSSSPSPGRPWLMPAVEGHSPEQGQAGRCPTVCSENAVGCRSESI